MMCSFIGTWKERFERILETLPKDVHGMPKVGAGGFKCILHVDMDAFFASVALRDKPELQERPVVISAAHWQGDNAEVSCANYPARKFGVKAGMWMKAAREKCPELVSLPYEFEKFEEVAETMYRALYDLTSFVNGVSCDEAYLDVTHLVCNIENEIERDEAIKKVVETLRQTIFDKTKCTASIGVGDNMLMARMATARAKPNAWGRLQLEKGGADVIAEFNVKELPHVGWSASRDLKKKFSVKTCCEMQKIPLEKLQKEFGPKRGEMMYNICRGIDNREWIANGVKERQTIGAQISWGVRMHTEGEVVEFLEALGKTLVERIACSEHQELGAKRVNCTVWRARLDADPNKRKGSLGHGQCEILQRTIMLKTPVFKSSDFAKHAFSLFKKVDCPPARVRGLGITASNFSKVDPVLETWFSKQAASCSSMDQEKVTEELVLFASNFESIKDSLDSGFRLIKTKNGSPTIEVDPCPRRKRLQVSVGSNKSWPCDGEECKNYECILRRFLSAVLNDVLTYSEHMNGGKATEFVEACKAYCSLRWPDEADYFKEGCDQILLCHGPVKKRSINEQGKKKD